MKDHISVDRINELHPTVRQDFTNFITDAENALGIILRIVQGYRTFEQQQTIYDQGRKTPGKIVTWSPPGTSYHNYGFATDVCPFKANGVDLDWGFDFSKLVPFAAKYGITWGGNFPAGKKDYDHFEKKPANWRDLLHKYQTNDFIPGTHYVNI